MKRLIFFLIRKRLGLKKYEHFRFENQKSNALYYFTESRLMKNYLGYIQPSNVKLNWILDDECKIIKLEKK